MARREVAVAVGATLLGGLFFVGSGFRNGDVAVYAAQAWAGDLASRPIHVVYVAVAAGLALVAGGKLSIALDVLNVAVAAIITGPLVGAGVSPALSESSKSGEGTPPPTESPTHPPLAPLALAAVFLAEAPFGEVDLPWMAAILLAAIVPTEPAAALFAALAIGISPSAIVALPLAFTLRGSARGLAAGTIAAVALLSALSLGDWWIGPRGVLEAHLNPGRSLEACAFALLAMAPLTVSALASPAHRRMLLACAPLVLLPSDIPGWLLFAVPGALALDSLPDRPRRLAAAGLVPIALMSLFTAHQQYQRIRAESDEIEAVVAGLQPDDRLVAPWSWGVRASVAATGTPYGLDWLPPSGEVPCDGRRIVLLPHDLKGPEIRDGIWAGCPPPR